MHLIHFQIYLEREVKLERFKKGVEIEGTLIKFNEEALPKNFVALAVKVVDLEAKHSAILIRHEEKNYLCHFTGKPPIIIENYNEENLYIYKIWDNINYKDSNEVGSFLQYCKRVCDKIDITYSYISDGSKHNFDGEFATKSGLPELGTCVGFCINTLTNALIDSDQYLHLDDWDDTGIKEDVDARAEKAVKKKFPDLDWSKYNAHKKRVTPLEYLCTAYFNEDHPVKKEKIAAIITQVQDVINKKFTKATI